MTIGLAMIVSGMMANPLATVDDSTSTQPQTVPVEQTATSTASLSEKKKKDETAKIINVNAGIEAQTRAYFADIPIMAEIARCESHFRQYAKDGSTFRGVVNNKDVGIMQVNEYYHLARAQKLGIDLYSVEGNLQYALRLFNEQGSQPWVSSSPCWGKTAAAKGDPLAYTVKVAASVAPVVQE
ncbi:MAG: hypothetical protein RL094_476 [Candidatus Parcubacteria bacterium]|jgi:hypothetical protein